MGRFVLFLVGLAIFFSGSAKSAELSPGGEVISLNGASPEAYCLNGGVSNVFVEQADGSGLCVLDARILDHSDCAAAPGTRSVVRYNCRALIIPTEYGRMNLGAARVSGPRS